MIFHSELLVYHRVYVISVCFERLSSSKPRLWRKSCRATLRILKSWGMVGHVWDGKTVQILLGKLPTKKKLDQTYSISSQKKTRAHLPCTSQFTQWIQNELSVPGNPKIILYTSSTISLTSDSSWPASFHFAGEGEACKAAKRTASPTGWRQQQKQTENSVDQAAAEGARPRCNSNRYCLLSLRHGAPNRFIQ